MPTGACRGQISRNSTSRAAAGHVRDKHGTQRWHGFHAFYQCMSVLPESIYCKAVDASHCGKLERSVQTAGPIRACTISAVVMQL